LARDGRRPAVNRDIPVKDIPHAPVLTGTFDGRPIAFPMRKDRISPDFDAFLVLPVE